MTCMYAACIPDACVNSVQQWDCDCRLERTTNPGLRAFDYGTFTGSDSIDVYAMPGIAVLFVPFTLVETDLALACVSEVDVECGLRQMVSILFCMPGKVIRKWKSVSDHCCLGHMIDGVCVRCRGSIDHQSFGRHASRKDQCIAGC